MQKKNEIQDLLFDLIRKGLPANIILAEKISEVLEIGIDSAYRRIRGENMISLDETVTLCKSFNLSLDELMYGTNKMQYAFVPSDLRKLSSYEEYVRELAIITEDIRRTPGSRIVLSAADIPMFHYFAYEELTLFQIFSWHKNVYDYAGSYEDFVGGLNVELIMRYCNKIAENYQQIPSTEVCTDSTMDTILKLIQYHFEMEHFNDREVPLLLCDQLLDLMRNSQEWIKNGNKGKEDIYFKLYVSDIDIGNSIIFMDNEKVSRCIIRLFTNNGLNIKDMRFGREVGSWLDCLIKRSTLISGVSSKIRFKFLNTQRQKIMTLRDHLENT